MVPGETRGSIRASPDLARHGIRQNALAEAEKVVVKRRAFKATESVKCMLTECAKTMSCNEVFANKI
jgi:hypothetical protein